LLEFAVPPNFEGNYTLYALYVEPGKEPLTEGLEKVGRSNLASQTITFYEDSSKLPDYTEREFYEIDGLNTSVSGDIDISRIKFGDFNGDGKTDIYYIAGSGDYDDSHIDNIHLSHGDGTYTSIKGIKTWISDNSHKATVNTLSRIKFGDFNGDGKTDIYYIAGWTGNDDSHIDKIHLSHGDGTYTTIKGIKTWISDNSHEATMNSISRIKFGDFNGDGKTDIYYIAGWTGNDDSHIDKIHLSHGDGTYTTIKGIKTWISDNGYEAAMNSISRIKFGDFNGDGKTDIYYIAGWTGNDDSHIDKIHLSHGDGTYTTIEGIKTWISDNGYEAAMNSISRIKFGDFNGDGKTDIYYIAGWTGNDDSHIDKIHLSHGDGTYTSIKGIKTWISDNGYEAAMNSISRIKFGDFNGDGKTDIYYIAGWTGNDDSHIDKIHLSHGDGTYTTIKGIKTWISDNGYEAAMNSISRIKFGDFNGDGSIDVYYVHGWGRVSLDKIHINSTK
jgi:uncharacterized protein YdgA (DUF945 family)